MEWNNLCGNGNLGKKRVQGSKMHSANDTNTNAVDTIFQDAVLQQYNYAQRSTSFHGLAKGVTAVTSAIVTTFDFMTGGIYVRWLFTVVVMLWRKDIMM